MGGMIQVPFHGAMVSRIEPAGPPQAYKTYTLSMPAKTHWRPATCEEAECEHYLQGWRTTVDTATELGQRQFHYITHDRTRSFTQEKAGGTLVSFTFGPGQKCFRAGEHKVRLERPAKFLVTPGDFRARTGPPRVHANGADWAEDCAEHQDRIIRAING